MPATNSSDNTKMATATVKKAVKSAAPVTVTVTAPVAAPVAAPVETKKAKKAEAPVAAPVVAEVPSPTEEDVSVALLKTVADLQEQFSALKQSLSTAANALKTLEKQAGRVVKKADRKKKHKVAGAEPKACIFTKPVKISAELCAFLGKPKDTEVSRSAVTKGVMEYAKAHNLMDKQTIKADNAMRKLLTLTETDTLTILNLQKFLRRHYIKPAAPTA
jgi:chromatin remodeling complex protein RSC6